VLTLEADVRPIVKNPDQYTGDFWRFDVIDKRGNVLCLADIRPFGINLGVGHDTTKGDQRIAGFACDTPPTPEIPISTPTPTATLTPECVGECLKDPVLDPENQGNNLPGGGGEAPVQTDGQVPPAGGDAPVTYTAPVAPAPSGPPVGSTPGGDDGGDTQGGDGLN